MSEQPPDQSEVAEAIAAYGTAAATLRAGLERIAAEHPRQPCRLVDDVEDGRPVMRFMYWGPTPDNDLERWQARCAGEPHPPRPMRWRRLSAFPLDADWTDEEVERLLARLDEANEMIRRTSAHYERRRPDCPPGYEDDYDLDDWFYDLRADPC